MKFVLLVLVFCLFCIAYSTANSLSVEDPYGGGGGGGGNKMGGGPKPRPPQPKPKIGRGGAKMGGATPKMAGGGGKPKMGAGKMPHGSTGASKGKVAPVEETGSDYNWTLAYQTCVEACDCQDVDCAKPLCETVAFYNSYVTLSAPYDCSYCCQGINDPPPPAPTAPAAPTPGN